MRDMRSGFSKVNETPVSMKQLIAEEMSKEAEHRQSSSNVVAKLMGLETLTQLHLEITTPPAASPSRSRSYSHCSESSVDSEAGNCHKQHREFEDMYEMCNSRKGKCNEGSVSDKQMDLVRQQFIEAKRLVNYDKLHQSKEFHEALEVLSSNKALFVKFLQESNSLFSQHLSDFQLVPSHPEAKRITLLRPSMAVDAQGRRCKQIKTLAASNQGTEGQQSSEPTRIVVLKPSPGKALDIKAIVSSPPTSPKVLHSGGYFDKGGSREVAREITRQMRVNLRGHQREETLISSVLSNGSIGDDGSLNLWECEHSWDCSNRDGSPFSSSSFSRASFTPESSVYREAKKRLSQRWAMMSLNGDTNQQKDLPKTSTVLGEMLTLSETKLHTRSYKESKQETRRSSSCTGSSLIQVDSACDSLNTLERSKSVPEISFYGTSKAHETPRSLKPSWKVSNLFFFRNKKANKEKTDRNTSQFTRPIDSIHQSTFPGEEELTTPNQDQPSPVSVLQPLFEEEYHRNPECSGSKTATQEETSLKPNLIDKSPRIGSIARVLDDSITDSTRPAIGILVDENWYQFIKTLITASGFNRNTSHDPLMSRWYSPNSPLDPSLIDNYTKLDNKHNKQLIHEAKRRKQRSNRKLIFDHINSIISETTRIGHKSVIGNGDRLNMVEHVWTHLKDWFEDTVATLDTVATNLGGERVVREEVVGRLWSDGLEIEIDKLGIEIEIMLLQELIEEAVFDLT